MHIEILIIEQAVCNSRRARVRVQCADPHASETYKFVCFHCLLDKKSRNIKTSDHRPKKIIKLAVPVLN